MHLGIPYRADGRGRTASAADDHSHVRNLVEQTLLTTPGERVNRPEFGTGLLDMVFEPSSDTLVDAMDVLVRTALQRWLQDIVMIETLSVRQDEAHLIVDLTYKVLATGRRDSQTITRVL